MIANTSYVLPEADTKQIQEQELQLEEPTGAGLVVDVTHAGVCHTDIHVREGGYDMGSLGFRRTPGIDYPLAMGHEIAGVVSAVGPDVTERRVGDAVVVYPWLGCGECEVCATGMENLCMNASRYMGIMRPGGYAAKVPVPHEKYAVPLDGVDPAWAATLACSGLTAVNAAEQVAGVEGLRADDPVVVIGAGGVGLMVVAALVAQGQRNVTVLDRSDANFGEAVELGAVRGIVTTDETTPKGVLAELGAAPAAAVDVVGAGPTMTLAYALIRKGGRVVPIGLFGGEMALPTASFALGQKSIVGNFVGGRRHLDAALRLAREGRLPRVPIAETPMSAESVQTALDELEAGRSRGRTVLTA
ncbi:alcohol dehydrogenase catalytic domain-containing protein [Micrococcus endophyticus]|uniref:alcohol dehydrogenase catalytic domain-containing protein n=1 Tax=Micrococcus endophyticus TaxID=455343 RepID=UPI0034CF5DD3